MALDKFTIKLAPTKDIAQALIESETVPATVEAEYGDFCVEGTEVTLAHHGSRSANPAPCNTKVEPLQGGTILVSHLDLDSIGGIMALTGDKIDDPEFWKAAEYIDVNGPHHVHEFPQEVQDKLNAVWAWNATQPRVRYTELTDVTPIVAENYSMLSAVLDERHPEHDSMIQKGKEWEAATTQAVESKLVSESGCVRAFKTDGVFCAGSYYSPTQDAIVPATLTFNEKFKAITIAFADGGQTNSAKAIVQQLWGPEAGGRDGIAGSPRGVEMTQADFEKAQVVLEAHILVKDIMSHPKDYLSGMTAEHLNAPWDEKMGPFKHPDTMHAFQAFMNEYFKTEGYQANLVYNFSPAATFYEVDLYSDLYLLGATLELTKDGESEPIRIDATWPDSNQFFQAL